MQKDRQPREENRVLENLSYQPRQTEKQLEIAKLEMDGCEFKKPSVVRDIRPVRVQRNEEAQGGNNQEQKRIPLEGAN
jgi:hypothetical protein